jgi:hypothetical protein
MGALGDLRICCQCTNIIDGFVLGGVKDCHLIASGCQDYFWLCDNCIRKAQKSNCLRAKSYG